MSVTTATVLRNEAGVHVNPGTLQNIDTHCTLGGDTLVKKYSEVYIHWNPGPSQWVEDAVYDPLALNTQVALKVTNPCTGAFSYVSIGLSDYRLLTLCCQNCPLPLNLPVTLPDGFVGVAYSTTVQILGGGGYSIQVEVKPAWMTITLNPTTGVITFSGTPDTDGPQGVQVLVNNCSKPADEGLLLSDNINIELPEEMPLNNFEDNPVPGLPFGMFMGDETFLGRATTMQQAADIWNNDLALAAIGTAYPIVGSTNSLAIVNPTGPLPDVRALRYWSIDVATASTPELYLSADTIVRRANGVQVKSEVAGTLGNYTQFGLNANTYGIAGSIPLVDITSPYYRVTLTQGTNYIFHNETGDWAWCDVFGQFANNAGNLPPTIRHLAIQSNAANGITRNLAVDNFANFATVAPNVLYVSYNGSPCQYEMAWTLAMFNLETFQLIDTAATLRQWADLGIDSVNTPNLKWLTHRRNNVGANMNSDSGFWAMMPQLTKGLDVVGVQMDTTALVDEALIGLGGNLTTPAEPNARITVITQNAPRSSASDTAVTALQALGFTIG